MSLTTSKTTLRNEDNLKISIKFIWPMSQEHELYSVHSETAEFRFRYSPSGTCLAPFRACFDKSGKQGASIASLNIPRGIPLAQFDRRKPS